MRKIILLFTALLMGVVGFAQTANGFNFKALVTNSGNPVVSQVISVRVTFKEGTTVRWKETHAAVHTDANGIFSIEMGQGTRVSGVASFDKVDWNVGNMNYTVEVDTGSGYHALVSNEYFKRVPYAKVAERLAPTNYDVTTYKHNIWAKNDGTGDIDQGFRLSHGTTDWYMYMKSNDGFTLRKDGHDYFGIDATNAKAWFKGSLDIPASGITFRNTSGSYTNGFYLTTLSDGLAFKYNNAQVMKMHGAASVEVMGKLRAPATGDANMMPLAYGNVAASGSITGGTGNFTVTKIGTGAYTIQVSSVSMADSNTVITVANGASAMGFIRAFFYSGKAYVYTLNTSGADTNHNFHFVIYKK